MVEIGGQPHPCSAEDLSRNELEEGWSPKSDLTVGSEKHDEKTLMQNQNLWPNLHKIYNADAHQINESAEIFSEPSLTEQWWQKSEKNKRFDRRRP